MVTQSIRSAGAQEPAKAASFWIVAGLVGSAFTAQLGGNPRTQAGATLGVLSTASASATMLAPSLGVVMVAAFGWRSMMFLNLPLIAAALAIVMLALTDNAKSAPSAPFFDPVLLRNHRITAGLAMSMLVAMVMAATLTIGPFVLASQMRLPFAEIGFVMACGLLVSVRLAVRAGQLADRIAVSVVNGGGR